jgi:hypothetical protein
VIAIARGPDPTRIGLPAFLVRVTIGVTVAEPLLTAYAVRPLGVMAIAMGSDPTPIARPALPVPSETGVTLAEA